MYAATSETHFVHQSGYTDGGERREHASRKKGRSERRGREGVGDGGLERVRRSIVAPSKMGGRAVEGCEGDGASEKRCRAGERGTPGIGRAGGAG